MNTIINTIIALDLILAGIEFLVINKEINNIKLKLRRLEDSLIASELSKAMTDILVERVKNLEGKTRKLEESQQNHSLNEVIVDCLGEQVQEYMKENKSQEKNTRKKQKRTYRKIEEFNKHKYILTKGDKVIAKGTIAEISKKTGKTPERLRRLNNSTYLAESGKNRLKLLQTK